MPYQTFVIEQGRDRRVDHCSHETLDEAFVELWPRLNSRGIVPPPGATPSEEWARRILCGGGTLRDEQGRTYTIEPSTVLEFPRVEWMRTIRRARAMAADFGSQESRSSESACYGIANRIEEALSAEPAGEAVSITLTDELIGRMRSYDLYSA